MDDCCPIPSAEADTRIPQLLSRRTMRNQPRNTDTEKILYKAAMSDIVRVRQLRMTMDQPVDEDFEQSRKLLFTLNQARSLLVAELDGALKDAGINAQQLGIVLALAREGARSAVALSKLLGVDGGFMTRMLDGLEAKGMLHRSRNGEDRRVVDLSLTQKGRETAALSLGLAPAVLNRRLAHFTKPEFETLGTLLRKLLDG